MKNRHSDSTSQKNILSNILITAFFLTLGIALSSLLLMADSTGGFISMIFVLMVVLTARLTDGYVYGAVSSFVSVICVNYIFTYPYWEFNFTIAGYPLTFLSMLSVSLIISTMTSQIKQQEQIRLETERETMRANLLRAVSHDLRTPLTSIVGSASAILENDAVISDRQKRTLLSNIRDEAQWLVRMVENLLSITRIGDTTTKLNKEPEMAEEILSSVSPKFQKRFPNIELTVSVPQEPLFVPMDAILIEQVLMNLMENAAYHSNCSEIRISASREGANAVFCVQDNGCGIPPELLPVIFSSTHRHTVQDSDRRRNMGIGLSVCHSIVQAHDGAMNAENAPDGGSTFQFTLPLGEEQSIMEDFPYEDS